MYSTSTNPDGPRKRCRVCGTLATVHPSFTGDATCPRCGSLLWFDAQAANRIRIVRRRLEEFGARVSQLADSDGWSIDLSGLGVTETQISWLAAFETVEELFLNDTATTDAVVAAARSLPALEILELGNTRITDAACEALRELRQLEGLALFDTAVTDAGVSQLGSLNKLWCLDLDQTRITGDCLPDLRTLKDLEWLFVSHTDLNDAAIPSLCQFPRLEELHLLETQITTRGYEQLRAALPCCQVNWSLAGR